LEKLSLTSDAAGKTMFMLGNEAIARGAIEAGLQVYAAYPGTPSSEISETLINLAKNAGFYGEWSVNEKVAFEVAFGASMCGVRAMTSMKHVGLNVAHDALMSATYMGAAGGMVLVNADDPGQWSSQNEQDNRFIAEQAYLPVFEPCSAQEAKDMTVDAFRLSEEFGQIFMIRSVTRIGHSRGDVKLGPITQDKKKGEFKKSDRFQCMPAWSRKNHPIMIERLNKIRESFETSRYNSIKAVSGAKLGIIASGISYGYTVEALRWLGLEDKVAVLKIGTPHPLPVNLIKSFLTSVPEVLVVEELEPFVENHVAVIAQKADIRVKIHGKDYIPLIGELGIRKVTEAIAKLTGARLPEDFTAIDKRVAESSAVLPLRPPTLCAGCPHRASFHAINVAVRKVKRQMGERVLTGDIGCYSLGIYAPLNGYDAAACMGGGFGLANGAARGQSGPVVGHLGDSTFFHSGISAMINAVFNKTRCVMVVFDNSATSMTGFQPHPGSPGAGEIGIKPEDVARACNVKFVEVVDAFNLKQVTETIERAIRFDGPAVVISRGLCAILSARDKRQRGEKAFIYKIDPDSCNDCKLCLNSLGCPAIIIVDGRTSIDPAQCDGCGLCAQVCAFKAILREEKK
jgi:indolepyruvate ferredoxin oxidoreductase, alpha subunit